MAIFVLIDFESIVYLHKHFNTVSSAFWVMSTEGNFNVEDYKRLRKVWWLGYIGLPILHLILVMCLN